MHLPTVEPQFPVVGSQMPEQHWFPLWHALAVAPHPGPALASPDGNPLVDPPHPANTSTMACHHDRRGTLSRAPRVRATGFMDGAQSKRRATRASPPTPARGDVARA